VVDRHELMFSAADAEKWKVEGVEVSQQYLQRTMIVCLDGEG